MSSRKVRVKKLSVKTGLPVLREDQIDPSEYEALSTETQIATGVEQAEENVSCFRHSQSIAISRAPTRDITWHGPLHPITMDNQLHHLNAQTGIRLLTLLVRIGISLANHSQRCRNQQ
jgi:hypothetical protein